jgi:hypothetical protein
MGRDEIIDKNEVLKMARQAELNDEVLVPWSFEIQAFAKLVIAKAVEREREACAKVCEQQEEYGPLCETIWDCAAAIRARGEA